MAEKVRLRRKDLKQPDEFITLSRQALAWGREHRQLVTWGGAALVAVIAVVGITSAYRVARVRDANADLSRAMNALGSGQFAAAASELKGVSDRWAETSVAPLARLLAANAALRAGDADTAIAELTALEPSAPALPGYLQQQRLLALGSALEMKEQWLDAAAKYQAAVALTGPYTGEAVLGEARTRDRAGEGDRARELYRQAYDQFPDLPNRELIATKIQL